MVIIEQISSMMLINLKTDAETYFSLTQAVITVLKYFNVSQANKRLLDKIFGLDFLDYKWTDCCVVDIRPWINKKDKKIAVNIGNIWVSEDTNLSSITF